MGRDSRGNAINDSWWCHPFDDTRGCHPLYDAQCYTLDDPSDDDSWGLDPNGPEGNGNGNALSSSVGSDDSGADAGFPLGERD